MYRHDVLLLTSAKTAYELFFILKSFMNPLKSDSSLCIIYTFQGIIKIKHCI